MRAAASATIWSLSPAKIAPLPFASAAALPAAAVFLCQAMVGPSGDNGKLRPQYQVDVRSLVRVDWANHTG
jgi:hypothetical protein